MFLLRLLIIGFLLFYSYSMGQIPANQLNDFGKLISGLFFLTAPIFYFLPSFEALLRRSPNLAAISAINLLAGWTLVGWIIAYAWALKRVDTGAQPVKTDGIATMQDGRSETKVETKVCPFCAEEVRFAAIKCKHCGSDISSTAAD